ncbi:CynX/NimT family MFS transporter [Pseudomonas sp. C11]|uniref:MFS transporter n=1 Tax=Pseudomonas sp. C11 TaxID=3075550 RepID=UPI002AFFED9E|nr:MFS transporter [Pseudomonas sp. C11]
MNDSSCTAIPLTAATPLAPAKRRWAVALLFALVLCANQTQVCFLIPQQTQIQLQYGLGELASSLSILIIPILCILLSVPAGRLIDRAGFRRGMTLGSGVLALSLPLRVDDSFFGLMLGQLLIGISQPLLLNGISRMAIEWFEEHERGTAIGIATAGLFLGLAMGLALPPMLVAKTGIAQGLLITGLVGLLPAGLLWLCSASAPPSPRGEPAQNMSLVHLFRSTGMRPVLLTTLAGCGLFNALALSLEPMLTEHGLGAETLSAAGALMILAGVIGSLFIDSLAQRVGGKFIVLAGCGVCVIPMLCLLYYATAPTFVLLYAALLGACQLPGYALLIAMSEQIAGKAQAAQANALITLAGNLGAGSGMGLAVLIHAALGHWAYVIVFLTILAVLQTLIVTLCRSMRRL